MASLPPLQTRRQRQRNQPKGFSLPELLIGIVISAVVLVAGVKAFLDLIQTGESNQQELNRRDNVARVLGLLEDEIRNARSVETGTLTSLSATNCPTTPLLILRGNTSNGSEDISYGRLDVSNTTWRGPSVLVRCGPPYKTNQTLDTTATRSEVGVLDNLQTAGGFTATTLRVGTDTINRNVQISLISNASLDNNRSRKALTSTIQVPINSAATYSANDSGLSCPSTGCADPNGYQMHYQPTLGGTSINGSADKENIFYFQDNYLNPDNTPAYSLTRTPGSGTCTSEQCTVRQGTNGPSVTIFNGTVLVFNDQEIRL